MISIIVACSKDRVIGMNNAIPWHIKEDFLHFKNYTTNKKILMGKNTYYSIGKPLPNRFTYIACNDEDLKLEYDNVRVCKDLFEILDKYKDSDEELVVCGGAMIYKLALPYVDKLIISEVKGNYIGDTYFPTFGDEFKLVNEEERDEFVIKTYLKSKQ